MSACRNPDANGNCYGCDENRRQPRRETFLAKRNNYSVILSARAYDSWKISWILRVRCNRPSCRTAAEADDEFSPLRRLKA
jgi:hypothetical protein